MQIIRPGFLDNDMARLLHIFFANMCHNFERNCKMSESDSSVRGDWNEDHQKFQDINRAIREIDDKIRRLEIALKLRPDETESK